MSDKQKLIKILDLNQYIDDLTLIDDDVALDLIEFLEKVYSITNKLEQINLEEVEKISNILKLVEDN